MVKAAYQHDAQLYGRLKTSLLRTWYHGFWEMVEGLTIGYGFGELEPNTTNS